MPIRIDCPRCQAHLQLPSKSAGGYVHCPQCQGRIWVPKEAVAAAPAAATAGSSAGGPPAVNAPPTVRPAAPPGTVPLRKPAATAAPPAPAAVPVPSPVPVAPSARPPAQPKSAAAAEPKPPQKPPRPSAIAKVAPPATPAVPQTKKVARLITAQAADSTLQLAPDGKLPDLHLDDRGSQMSNAKSKSVNPWVLLGLLAASIVFSVALVLVPMGSSGGASREKKAAMRERIESEYFGSSNPESNADLEPYQILLRDAQRAYTRGDHKTERRDYVRVLEMLRAERSGYEKGLTGSRTRDRELEEALSVLLSGG